MAFNKLNMISEIYDEEIRNVTDDSNNWTSFLKCASMNYKYSFSEQLLIYAQKPTAIACADFDTWNNSLNRYVNSGAKGIALIVEKDGYIKLRYVFDVSDTHSKYGRLSKKIALWKVGKSYEEQVIESLENKYGELDKKDTFPNALLSVSKIMVDDNYFDYLNELTEKDENTFKKILTNSVSYMLLTRNGIDPSNYLNISDFDKISEFKDMNSITVLGSASSDISEMGLREIYNTLKNIRINEIEKIRTFDRKENIVYDENEKRRDSDESSVHESRELQPTEYSSERSEESRIREVFNDEIRLHEEKQEHSISTNDDEGLTNTTSIGSGNNGSINVERNNESLNDRREYNRGFESNRPNEMDRDDEQYQIISRGNNQKRTNLQLENENTEDSILFSNSDKYVYKVGDKVFIGLDELEVTKIGLSNIELYEPQYPLLTREINIVEFETKLKENPANDHLKVVKEKNDLEYEIITPFNEIDEEHSYTVARVINDINCVELHYYKGNSTIEIGTKQSDNSWESVIEKAEWFNKNLSDEKVFDKLENIFNDEFGITKEQETYYGEYNDEIDLIEHILSKYNIEDINTEFNDDGIIIANDDDGNIWEGKEFYDFLFNDLFTFNDDGTVDLIDNNDFNRLKEYCKKYETNIELTEKENNNTTEIVKTPNFSQSQLSLFSTREQELADRLLEILNSFDTKWKDTLIISDVELAEWEHISSKKRNLSIVIKSNKYDDYNENAFTQFNSDKTDETILRDGLENNEFIQYLYKDSDFSIYISPTLIHVYWHNFDSKEVDLSVGKNIVLKSINNEENVVVVDDNETQLPIPKKKVKEKVVNYVLHPEIPYHERINYKIKQDYLGVGTPKERYSNNIEAIKIIRKCEEEDRYATQEEQEILSKYVGWGGLSEAFNKDGHWLKEYQELRSLLNDEEYKLAMESTLTAFYTPPIVIKSMYKALENMGLKKGNILEPSCGIGNFIGMLPNNDDLKIYGVEIDSISGKIAKQLYQKSSIAIKGFEEVNYSDSFFDVAIGNVPFGDLSIIDKRYEKNHFVIHDYFFAKTIDKVRPGGVIAFITSQGTMDKENSDVRKYIAQRANLLGAIRLPNDTFKSSAGTTVTSDIIFLQKRDSITDIIPNWVNIGINENGLPINEYYIEHPENVLGKYEMISTQFGMKPACLPFEDKNLGELLDSAISNINAEIKDYEIDEIDEEDLSIEADLNVNNFSYTLVDDKVYYRENSRMYPQELPLTTENRVKGLIELRDVTRELINLQLEDYPDEEIEKKQVKLNELYDKFSKKYGLINSRANASAFNGDNSYYLLCSLEILDENGNLSRKADMFSKRTIKATKRAVSIDNSNDALIVSIGERAKVDLDFMSEITHKSKEDLIKDLEGIIFKLPSEETYVTADEYLSGNIREKIRDAENANEKNKIYDINLKYLYEAKPQDLNASEISVRLGTTWIPKEDYESFMFELFDTDYYAKRKIKINYSDIRDEWNIENKGYDTYNEKVKSTYGTKRINGYKIFEETLNLKDVKIYDYFEDEEGKRKQVLNGKETAIAQAKQEQIKQAFQDWIWEDPDRRTRL